VTALGPANGQSHNTASIFAAYLKPKIKPFGFLLAYTCKPPAASDINLSTKGHPEQMIHQLWFLEEKNGLKTVALIKSLTFFKGE